MVWEVTEERKMALYMMSNLKQHIICPNCKASLSFIDIVPFMEILQDMLKEVE